MQAEHLAIDGSIVMIEADGDLSTGATATGWVITPALMRAHPFATHPPGHSRVVEDAVRGNFSDVEILNVDEFSLKDGTLRVAEARIPTATGVERTLTVGAWEGEHGCLATSVRGSDRDGISEMFDSLRFSDRPQGVAVDAPVTVRPRPPEVAKEIPGVGVLAIRPASRSELERVPRQPGLRVRHGELFRIRQGRRAMLYVSPSVVATIDPGEDVDEDRLTYTVEGLRITWAPRRAGAGLP
jgi:hypothetical protein